MYIPIASLHVVTSQEPKGQHHMTLAGIAHTQSLEGDVWATPSITVVGHVY